MPPLGLCQRWLRLTPLAVAALFGAALFGAAPARAQTNNTLTLALIDDVYGSRCLDGSPFGYYYKQASAANATKFLIELQGGGWCYGLADCYARSLTTLGSSKEWPTTVRARRAARPRAERMGKRGRRTARRWKERGSPRDLRR